MALSFHPTGSVQREQSVNIKCPISSDQRGNVRIDACSIVWSENIGIGSGNKSKLSFLNTKARHSPKDTEVIWHVHAGGSKLKVSFVVLRLYPSTVGFRTKGKAMGPKHAALDSSPRKVALVGKVSGSAVPVHCSTRARHKLDSTYSSQTLS